MADVLPDSGADQPPPNKMVGNADLAAPEAFVDQRRPGLTWIVLVLLLIVAVGLLASDVFRGRLPQSRAFKQINEKLSQQSSADSARGAAFGGGGGTSKSTPMTAEGVHELLGRQPDASEKKSADINDEMVPILVETYRYPGIIKSYNVVVMYLEQQAGKAAPMTALWRVRKQ
ncbi:MAG TPA: hypothetical protein VHX65_13840 [Pirellulales bacterium]|jgi:hypothetical protein|nr:hypothetical protein [Pirellulales bacterium]